MSSLAMQEGADLPTLLAANPRLRRLVEILESGPRRSADLADAAGVSRVTLSRDLGRLKRFRVVEETHPYTDGRLKFYALRNEALEQKPDLDARADSMPRPQEQGALFEAISSELSTLGIISRLEADGVSEELPPFAGADPQPRQQPTRPKFADVQPEWVSPTLAVVIRRLSAGSTLSFEDIAIAHQLVGPPVRHAAGDFLGDDGDGSCRLLIAGWACRRRATGGGRAVVFDVLLPGDAIGFSVRPRFPGLYRVEALGAGVSVDATELRDWMRSGNVGEQGLGRASLEAEQAEMRRLMDHLSRLGGRMTYSAAADLFVHLHDRLDQVGLVDQGHMPMFLTQKVLAEALGVSVIQVNRVMAALRRADLIAVQGGFADIPSIDALRAAADSCDGR